MTKYIDFYHLGKPGERFSIEQSPMDRLWMTRTHKGYAYRCLPMTYANRHGWCVKTTSDVRVLWNGNIAPVGLTIMEGRYQKNARFADNGTGNGIITFHPNFIPRTPPDWNLWVMPAPNLVIPGASCLSGIVESDWMTTPLTANWKVTDIDKEIIFKAGDPVIFFIPIHKTEMETFELRNKYLNDDEDLKKHYSDFIDFRKKCDAEGVSAFSRNYNKGLRHDKTAPEDEYMHKTRLSLSIPPDPNMV